MIYIIKTYTYIVCKGKVYIGAFPAN